jgi:UDP-glucose 4-epimerase
VRGKNVIVAGGAGFIGSNLVDRLANDNKVFVIDNMHTGSMDNLKDAMKTGNVTFIKDDIKNIANHNIEADYIFHLGMYSSTPMYRENPSLVGEVVHGMIGTLEYAKKAGAPVVFASTSSLYNGVKPPHNEDVNLPVTDYYTEAKVAAERLSKLYVDLHGLNVAGMRFFSVYGYHEKSKGKYANLATQFLLAMKKAERPVIYGDGLQKRDFVFVSDVVDAMIRAAEHNKGFNAYNVGRGENYNLNELVEKINTALGTGIKPEYVSIPIKNYVMETLADTTKSEKMLGFKAQTHIDKGIELLNNYYDGEQHR